MCWKWNGKVSECFVIFFFCRSLFLFLLCSGKACCSDILASLRSDVSICEGSDSTELPTPILVQSDLAKSHSCTPFTQVRTGSRESYIRY